MLHMLTIITKSNSSGSKYNLRSKSLKKKNDDDDQTIPENVDDMSQEEYGDDD